MRPKLWMCVISPAGNLGWLQNDFQRCFVAEGSPDGAAMFSGKGSAANIVLYFSPRAVTIFGAVLKTAGAESCVAPDRFGIHFIAGGPGDAG